jgi:hypothetical protein
MAALLQFFLALFSRRERRDLAPMLVTKAQKRRRQESLREGHLADAGDDD